jgi:hypothetical protein
VKLSRAALQTLPVKELNFLQVQKPLHFFHFLQAHGHYTGVSMGTAQLNFVQAGLELTPNTQHNLCLSATLLNFHERSSRHFLSRSSTSFKLQVHGIYPPRAELQTLPVKLNLATPWQAFSTQLNFLQGMKLFPFLGLSLWKIL